MQSGFCQHNNFNGYFYNYLDWCDRKVLAAPFFTNEEVKTLDIFTYNEDGIQYIEKYSPKDFSEKDLTRRKKFIENIIKPEIKSLLLSNLYLDEMQTLISQKPLTLYQLIKGLEEIELEKVMDLVEKVI